MEWMISLLFLLELVLPIPIKDDRGRHRAFPVATVSLVVINIIVHIAMMLLAPETTEGKLELYLTYGAVPQDILEQNGLGALSLVTSGFIHVDWFHLAGNMFLLLFFGRKVEDLTGSFRFVQFYLLCLLGSGIVSTIGTNALSPINAARPGIGASGAVMGVMAAYLFLFAEERISTLVIPIPYLFRIPAWVYIIYNFCHDLLLGLLSQELAKEIGFSPISIGAFAHMGGLITGLICIYLYLLPETLISYRRGR